MCNRLAVLFLAALFGGGLASAAGCAGPYSEAPEKLAKPKKKKPPADEVVTGEPEADATGQAWEDACKTNFYAEPVERRRGAAALALSGQADRILVEAEQQEGATRVATVGDAMSKLSSALKQDPYGPEPTYKLAVAYTLVGKKGCALRLLERLAELQNYPAVEKESGRVIQRALNDMTFDPFRKEADAALGH